MVFDRGGNFGPARYGLSGNTIVIGSPNATSAARLARVGLCVHRAGLGLDQHYPDRYAYRIPHGDCFFGGSVSISGNTIAIVSRINGTLSSAVDVFAQPTSGWTT